MKVRIAMPVPYEEKTIKFDGRDGNTYKTNKSTYELFERNYTVLKGVISDDIRRFAMDVWLTLENHLDFSDYILHDNSQTESGISTRKKGDVIPSGLSKGVHTSPQGVALTNYLHSVLDRHIDVQLDQTYSFSRKYFRDAYLGAHTDRPSCEISVTTCLDYKSDDGSPWKIWIRNDKDYGFAADIREPNSISDELGLIDRKSNHCYSLDLEPGDILVYQGPKIIHWRDHFVGEYSYHIFSHYAMRHHGWGTYFTENVNALKYDGRESIYHSNEGYQDENFVKWFCGSGDYSDEIIDDVYNRNMFSNIRRGKLNETHK